MDYPLVAFSTKEGDQKMNPATHGNEDNASAPVLYMALELSNKSWRLAFGDGAKRRQVSVPAADLAKLAEAVAKAKEHFKLPASARVLSCYEAGRDGFWLHRHLRSVGMMRLGAIGPTSAWLLVMEFFGWRAFRNRREVAALAGLVGTPYNSGDSERDQGV